MMTEIRWGTLGSLIERVRTGSVLAPLLALTVICGSAAFGVTLRLGEAALTNFFGVYLPFASLRPLGLTWASHLVTRTGFKQKTIGSLVIGLM